MIKTPEKALLLPLIFATMGALKQGAPPKNLPDLSGSAEQPHTIYFPFLRNNIPIDTRCLNSDYMGGLWRLVTRNDWGDSASYRNLNNSLLNIRFTNQGPGITLPRLYLPLQATAYDTVVRVTVTGEFEVSPRNREPRVISQNEVTINQKDGLKFIPLPLSYGQTVDGIKHLGTAHFLMPGDSLEIEIIDTQYTDNPNLRVVLGRGGDPCFAAWGKKAVMGGIVDSNGMGSQSTEPHEGWSVENPGAAYPSKLSQLLGVPIAIYPTGGGTTRDYLAVPGVIEELARTSKIFFAAVGDNDAKSFTGISEEEFHDNLARIVRTAKNAGSQEIIVISPLVASKKMDWLDPARAVLFGDIAEVVAREEGVYFIDIRGRGVVPESGFYNYLHLYGDEGFDHLDGHRILATYIAEKLRSMGEIWSLIQSYHQQ